MRSARELKLLSIHTSLEAQFFVTFRVNNSDVILASPVNAKASIFEGRKHILTIVDKPLFNHGLQIRMDGLFGLGACILGGGFAPADKAGIVQVGMFRLEKPRPIWVVRSGPALTQIVQVTKHIKLPLPAGRARVERLAGGKLHPWDDKMQFVVSGM